MVAPNDDMFGDDKTVAGILGPNILHAYDLDLDFGNNKLNLMSQDHCEGKVIYWSASAVAMVPMRVAKSWHIVVPVTLDGHQYNAMLDTGAFNTTLNFTIAESDFGLKPGSPDMKPVANLGDRDSNQIYSHIFKSLAFEGISISNPNVTIIADLMKGPISKPPPIGTRLPENDEAQGLPDMLVGMDVLRHFHIYIAYKEQRLYITPADAPQPTVASQVSATPTPATAAPH